MGGELSLRRCVLLALLTLAVMLPVTLPVPVLKGLVVERFGVSGAAASWFMATTRSPGPRRGRGSGPTHRSA